MKWGKKKKDVRMGQKLTCCVGNSYLRIVISMWCMLTRLWKRDRKMENPCRYVKPPGSIAWRREDKKEGD